MPDTDPTFHRQDGSASGSIAPFTTRNLAQLKSCANQIGVASVYSDRNLRVDEQVTNKRQPATIGGPRGDVDSPLAAEEFGNNLDGTGLERQQPQLNFLVGRVSLHVFVIRQKHNPFTVRRGVRKPVVVVVGNHWLLLGAVRPHAPDLHSPPPRGVEVDELPVRTVFGAVVQAGRGGQTFFFAPRHGSGIDIEVAVSLGSVDD